MEKTLDKVYCFLFKFMWVFNTSRNARAKIGKNNQKMEKGRDAMLKFMSKSKRIVFWITIALDLALGLFAIFFSDARSSIRVIVAVIMLIAIAHEVYAVFKSYKRYMSGLDGDDEESNVA